VRFSTRGVQEHQKNFLGEVHVKNFWPKKLRGKKNPFVFSHRIGFIAFLAVSLHEEPKNTIQTQIFSKIRPRKSQKSQKKAGRYRIGTSLFFLSSAPLASAKASASGPPTGA
jgi:hypothetical protein